MEKMTNVKALAYVLAHADLPEDVKAKVEDMKAQFEKKNSSGKKPTANQAANDALKEAILSEMESGRLYTISEMMKELPSCKDHSNQKLSAVVRQMLGVSIERVEKKRKAYFRKVG